MQIEPHELDLMLQNAAEMGAKKALLELGLAKPFLSLSQAQKVYGKRVHRWIKEGLINKVKDGDATSTVRLDRIQLDNLAKSSNRNTYMNTSEMLSKALDPDNHRKVTNKTFSK